MSHEHHAVGQLTAADRLRAAELRVTPIRVAVIDFLVQAAHSDADSVRRAVHERLGSVSVQSVYDALNALQGAGVVRKIELASHPALFEIHDHDNHHHMACRSCGRVLSVPCAVGFMPCLTPSETHGFVLDEAEVIYWGVCPACREA